MRAREVRRVFGRVLLADGKRRRSCLLWEKPELKLSLGDGLLEHGAREMQRVRHRVRAAAGHRERRQRRVARKRIARGHQRGELLQVLAAIEGAQLVAADVEAEQRSGISEKYILLLGKK